MITSTLLYDKLKQYYGICKNKAAHRYLNTYGLRHMVPSVRRRRLFACAYRILIGTFDFNRNLCMTKKAFDDMIYVLDEIKANKVDDDDSYFIKTEGVFMNEIFDEVQTSIEMVTEDYTTEEKNFVPVEELIEVPNAEKFAYIKSIENIPRNQLAFEKRRAKRIEKMKKVKEFWADEKMRGLIVEYNKDKYAPVSQMYGAPPRKDPDTLLYLWEKGFTKFKFPWNKENAELVKYAADEKIFPKIAEPLEDEVKKPDSKPHVDKSYLLDQPDVIIQKKTRVEEVTKIIHHTRIVPLKKEETIKNSTNHLGLPQSKLNDFCEEIYEISQMPGFSCLKQHLKIMPYKRMIGDNFKNIKTRLLYNYDEMSIKFKSLTGTKSRRKGNKPSRKLSRKQRKKLCLKEKHIIEKDDLDYVNDLILQNQKFYEMAKNASKESMVANIKEDLFKLSKDYVNNSGIWTVPQSFYNKRKNNINMPYQVHRRYVAIIYSYLHRTDLYESLKSHFAKFKSIQKRSRQKFKFEYSDY